MEVEEACQHQLEEEDRLKVVEEHLVKLGVSFLVEVVNLIHLQLQAFLEEEEFLRPC